MKKISVIVLTLNSENYIKGCLESINEQIYPRKDFEVVVIDSNSKDKTREIAKELGARVVNTNKKGFAKCRNFAIKEARHPWVAFTDSDCIVDKNWLKELVRVLEEKKINVAGGPAPPPKDGLSLFGKCVSVLGYPAGGIARTFEKPGFTKELSTCNIIFNKNSAINAGLFDESMEFGCEDTDFVKALSEKEKIFFNPKAVVFHLPRETISSFAKWWIRRGKGDYSFHKKHLPAFPRSLVSPKVSKLQHTLLALALLIVSAGAGIQYFVGVSLLLAGFIVYSVISLQKKLDLQLLSSNTAGKLVKLNRIHYYTTIPLLNYSEDVLRDIGRLLAIKESFFKNQKPVLTKR